MRLLIINTLPKEHLLAEKAICRLEEKTAECKTFYIKPKLPINYTHNLV